jgi:solute carrier family 35 protein F5
MVLLWPILIVLHIYRIEIFQLPKNWKEWISILVNVLFGSLIPNYLWNIAFMLTTPLVVAIGISFTVPITLISEYFYGKEQITWVYLVAGSMVVLGFLLINLSTLYPESDCDCKVPSTCCCCS